MLGGFFCLKIIEKIEHQRMNIEYNSHEEEKTMLEFVLNTAFWTLALYGLFEIVKNIIYISTYTKFQSDGMYLIVAVKNQEEKIEGFLRSILFKILYGKEEYFRNILVVDLKSKDNTKEILKRLEMEYDNIKVLNWKDCKDMIDNIE